MCFLSEAFQPLESIHQIRELEFGGETRRYEAGRARWVWLMPKPTRQRSAGGKDASPVAGEAPGHAA